MDLHELIDWAFKGLLSLIALYLTNVISHMRSSIDELHKAVAVEIEKAGWIMLMIDKTEKRLDRIEEKVFDLEKHKPTQGR